MQQRLCGLCQGPLSLERYNLYHAWSLTKKGIAVDHRLTSLSETQVEIETMQVSTLHGGGTYQELDLKRREEEHHYQRAN